MAVKPERRPAALLYAELRNFTRLSEVLQPDKVLELANDFFTFAAKNVIAGSGNVLSVQNDSLLAAFVKGEAQRFNDDALRTAQAIQRDFGPIGERWRNEYGPRPPSPRPAQRRSGIRHGGPARRPAVCRFRRLRERGRAHRAPRARRRDRDFLDVMKALGVKVQSLGAQELPPLELGNRRPALPIYGMVLETRLDFT